jgi:acyl carrier protein
MGMLPLEPRKGLELFDTALGVGDVVLVPLALETGSLRSQARAGMLPALLRGLVRVPARRVVAGSLARRLAGVPEGEREGVVLELVRGHVAAVLGHASPQAIEAERAFKELGFDSLAAVELRNRLNTATGLRLPATLIFDYPTPQAVAGHVMTELMGSSAMINSKSGEIDVHQLVAAIPISRLRKTGILTALSKLANSTDEELAGGGDREELIEMMDIETLARMTLEGAD